MGGRGRQRGAASLELAIGAVIFVSVAVMVFEAWLRTAAVPATGRMAVAMAEYVSRAGTLDAGELDAWAEALKTAELGSGARAHYVITMIKGRAAPDKALVEWVDRIDAGTAVKALENRCTGYGSKGEETTLDGYTAPKDEATVVVEVCARTALLDLDHDGVTSLTGGWTSDIRRHHLRVVRDQGQVPAAPSRP